MRSDFAKMRPIAGLFLEALMLVFIFVYSHGEPSLAGSDTKESPISNVLSFHEVVLRSNWSAQNTLQLLTRFHVSLGLLPSAMTDVAANKLSLSDALNISHYERSNFYITSTDNAP